jgi:asparagine synthase (glutamine-hydrolysing)
MFAFAFAASGRDEDRARKVRSMLDAWPSRPPDGEAVAHTHNATAGVLRWAVVGRDRRVVPLCVGDAIVVGDVRLYNRPELKQALDIAAQDDLTDLELAWLSYLRWGNESPKHLIGDFAFLVWNSDRRVLFAARDHMGVRPLYYLRRSKEIFVASDVRQLLTLIERSHESINDHKLVERLSRCSRTHGQTYFKEIACLRPGHFLAGSNSEVSQERYWLPRIESPVRQSYADDCEELRGIFRRAVRDRLEADYPLILHSSGGFDSSTIVMLANEVYEREPHRPELVTAAATMIGMPCDDSFYMDVVKARTRFENVRWSAFEDNFADLEAPSPAYPGERRGPGGGPRGDLILARQRGARVLISGLWGDSVLFAWGIFRDLFRHLRLGALIEETFGQQSLPAALRRLAKASLGAFSPRMALNVLGRRASRSGPPPAWLGPQLRGIFPPPIERLDPPAIGWPSHFSCEFWARLTSPQAAHSTDAMMRYGAEDGIEVRMPYADVRLIERILTIPWDRRLPNGDSRRLGRDAMGKWLPKEFENRLDQGSAMPLWGRAARQMLPRVDAILSHGRWLSGPYVNRAVAREIVRECLQLGEAADPRECLTAVDFGVVEAWLRRAFDYDNAAEVVR